MLEVLFIMQDGLLDDLRVRERRVLARSGLYDLKVRERRVLARSGLDDLKVRERRVLARSGLDDLRVRERRILARSGLDHWYSTFFVRVPPDIISLQLCTPKVVGV
jgi:hypothetical protein